MPKGLEMPHPVQTHRKPNIDLHPLLQGTPLKYDSGAPSTGTKKHDVRSIIGSPGRPFPALHPLDIMADPRALERACYEESLKSRSGTTSGAGGSITRGAPVVVPELGKPRQSPLTYEDHGAPFTSHLPRGSPVTTREPTPRLQEGQWVRLPQAASCGEGIAYFLQDTLAIASCYSQSVCSPASTLPTEPSLFPLTKCFLNNSDQGKEEGSSTCTSIRTRVQIPSTCISQAHSLMPVILMLHHEMGGQESLLKVTGHEWESVSQIWWRVKTDL